MGGAILINSIMDGSKVLNSTDMLYVCAMGVGIVFLGLIALVIICVIMSAIMKACAPKEKEKQTEQAVIPNRGEFDAAIAAAIAEDLGKDISAIRILSIKKL